MKAITDSLSLPGSCPPQRHFEVNAHVLPTSRHTLCALFTPISNIFFPDSYCINNETVLCEMKVLFGCVGFGEK